jgi:hypothetical protein
MKCRYCGESGGYYIKRKVMIYQGYDADGVPTDATIDEPPNVTPNLPRCSDCNKLWKPVPDEAR